VAMYCQECGFHQSEAHKFCGRCGALLIPEGQGTGETTGPFAITDAEAEAVAWEGPAIDGPSLAVRAGGPAGEVFTRGEGSVSVGRSPEKDIFLDDITVSRDHAELRVLAGGVVLRDLGSLNGTYVNRHRIASEQVLEDGDELQIGKFRLTFLAGG
jgi:hypothetical protein